MTFLVIGTIATNKNGGLLLHRDELGDLLPGWLKSDDYLPEHPAPLPLRFGHRQTGGWEVGSVVHLARCGPELIAVARLDEPTRQGTPGGPRRTYNQLKTWPEPDAGILDLLSDGGRWEFSAGVNIAHQRARPGFYERARLFEVAIVPKTAVAGARPLLLGSADAPRPPHGLPLVWDDIWEAGRAVVNTPRLRRAPDHLVVAASTRKVAPAPAAPRAPAPPLPLPGRGAGPRANGQVYATDAGLSGYGWQEDGFTVRVRRGGRVTGFER